MVNKADTILRCERKGYTDLVEISNLYDADQLKQLMSGKDLGVDYKKYCSPKFSWEEMLEYKKMLECDFSIEKIKEYNLDAWQLEQIRLTLMDGRDITPMLDKSLDYREMAMYRMQQIADVDIVKEYSNDIVLDYIRSKMPIANDELMLSFVKKFI